jgi:hypothetical protein
MSLLTRLFLILGAGITFYYVINRYRKSNFRISHTLFWILFTLFLFVTSFYPDYLFGFSKVVGVSSPTNLIFLIIIFVLLLKTFLLSLTVEEQGRKIEEIVLKSAQKELESEEDHDKK